MTLVYMRIDIISEFYPSPSSPFTQRRPLNAKNVKKQTNKQKTGLLLQLQRNVQMFD